MMVYICQCEARTRFCHDLNRMIRFIKIELNLYLQYNIAE